MFTVGLLPNCKQNIFNFPLLSVGIFTNFPGLPAFHWSVGMFNAVWKDKLPSRQIQPYDDQYLQD